MSELTHTERATSQQSKNSPQENRERRQPTGQQDIATHGHSSFITFYLSLSLSFPLFSFPIQSLPLVLFVPFILTFPTHCPFQFPFLSTVAWCGWFVLRSFLVCFFHPVLCRRPFASSFVDVHHRVCFVIPLLISVRFVPLVLQFSFSGVSCFPLPFPCLPCPTVFVEISSASSSSSFSSPSSSSSSCSSSLWVFVHLV